MARAAKGVVFGFVSSVAVITHEADAVVAQLGERWVEHRSLDAVFVHVDRGEESLVELSTVAFAGTDVEAFALFEKGQADSDAFLEQDVVRACERQ